MNLPKSILELVKAQNNFDSIAYANCFAETATVLDEGRAYTGTIEIEKWIAEANQKYKAVMKPIGYTESGRSSILTTEVSGTFEGSPLILNYHFEIIDGLIQSLEVTA